MGGEGGGGGTKEREGRPNTQIGDSSAPISFNLLKSTVADPDLQVTEDDRHDSLHKTKYLGASAVFGGGGGGGERGLPSSILFQGPREI